VSTVRLTVAQALVRFLANQYSERDGTQQRLIPGCFGIFGHGNVAGVGQALLEAHVTKTADLPYYLARNEQGMVHASVGYAKTRNRLQALACTASIGPGSANMLTGAALATTNRLPVLPGPAGQGWVVANLDWINLLQPPEPPTLLEVLVDHDALQDAEPGRELRHPLLGRLPRATERHHVRRHRARAGGGAGEHGAAVVCSVDRVGQTCAGDDRGQPELVPAREEHRGRIAQGGGRLEILGLGSLLRTKPGHPSDPQTLEQLAVAPVGDLAERGGGRDHHDVALGAAGEGREPRQDQLVPDLVLGAADQHDRARATQGATEVAERVSGFGIGGHGAKKCSPRRA